MIHAQWSTIRFCCVHATVVWLAAAVFLTGCACQPHALRKTSEYGDFVSAFTAPDIQAWRQIRAGMTHAEVQRLVGTPLATHEPSDSAGERAVSGIRPVTAWEYGSLRYHHPAFPRSLDYRVYFVDGHVSDVEDPFTDTPVESEPTVPRLLSPASQQRYSFYPRFVDFRWTPSYSRASVHYEVEIWAFTAPSHLVNENTPSEVWKAIMSAVPYACEALPGRGHYRWRVRAWSNGQSSSWTPFVEFVCDR